MLIKFKTVFPAFIAMLLVGGCASSNTTSQAPVENSVYKHAAYPHSQQELHDAYLAAIREMELDLISSSPRRLEARSNKYPATVIVEMGPADTLTTSVRVTSDYVMKGKEYTHYPYELSYKAFQHLDKDKGYAYVYPQAVYPAGTTDCRTPKIENPKEVKGPQLVGGLEGLAKRLSYTPEARQAGIEGRIYVEAVVNENGEVNCAEIDTGLPGGLNEMALQAIAQSRFLPATYRGKPVAMKVSLPVTFRR